MYRVLVMTAATSVLAAAGAAWQAVNAQGHEHRPGMTHQQDDARIPRQPGQAAFGAIAEVVAILAADSSTDWSKVDLERLRLHLIDMDEVTLRAAVQQENIEGGLQARVTGTGRTVDAIRRMSHSHAAALPDSSGYRMNVTDISGGVRVTFVAASGAKPAIVVRIRGLGFIGILASDDHHMRHHLALARGDSVAGHVHR